MELKEINGKLQLTAPYSADFPPKARSVGGKWIKEDRIWVFPIDTIDNVRNALRDSYGYDDTMKNVETRVRVTFLEDYTTDEKIFCIMGQQVAKIGYKKLDYLNKSICVNGEPYYDSYRSNCNNHRLTVDEGTILEFTMNVNLYKKKFAASKLRQKGTIEIEQIDEAPLTGESSVDEETVRSLISRIESLEKEVAELRAAIHPTSTSSPSSSKANRNAMDRMKRYRQKLAAKYGDTDGTHYVALQHYVRTICPSIPVPPSDDKIAQADLYQQIVNGDFDDDDDD